MLLQVMVTAVEILIGMISAEMMWNPRRHMPLGWKALTKLFI
jgi:hypothetical protein